MHRKNNGSKKYDFKVCLELPAGRGCPTRTYAVMAVGYHTKTKFVKKLIEKKFGYAVEEQILIFQNRRLDEDVASVGILTGSDMKSMYDDPKQDVYFGNYPDGLLLQLLLKDRVSFSTVLGKKLQDATRKNTLFRDNIQRTAKTTFGMLLRTNHRHVIKHIEEFL